MLWHAVLAKLKQQLLGASLVQLKPNQVFRQSSSLVLLKGNLHVTAQASKPPPSTASDDSGMHHNPSWHCGLCLNTMWSFVDPKHLC